MILETERLRLRPLVPEDADRIFPLMSHPDVMAYWDSSEINDPDIVRGIVVAEIAEAERGEAFRWAIETLADARFLGTCDISDFSHRHQRGEVGFMLSPDAWGQGYGLEAMRAVVVQAAAQGMKRLTARTHVGNVRSENLLRKLGFEEEGYLRGHVERDGERRDCRLWGLLL